MDDVRAVLGDFEWSFLAVTSQSYSPDVTGFRIMTSECMSVVATRHTGRTALTLLTSHSWLSSTASQLRQVQQTPQATEWSVGHLPLGEKCSTAGAMYCFSVGAASEARVP